MTVMDRVLPSRRTAPGGRCLMCGRDVKPGAEAMHLPRGGWVHRRCATYRMRTDAQRRR